MADEVNAITSSDVRPDDSDVAGSNRGRRRRSVQELTAEERKRQNQETVNKILDQNTDGVVLMKMERQNSSWTTRSGVIFTQEHPFQLVPEDEVDELLNEGGFRRADPKEVVNFYTT